MPAEISAVTPSVISRVAPLIATSFSAASQVSAPASRAPIQPGADPAGVEVAHRGAGAAGAGDSGGDRGEHQDRFEPFAEQDAEGRQAGRPG